MTDAIDNEKRARELARNWYGTQDDENHGTREACERGYMRAIRDIQERDRVIALSLLRSLCLSDHMGDAWNAVIKISKDIGFELPWPEDGECPDIDALEAMGALELYGDGTLSEFLEADATDGG